MPGTEIFLDEEEALGTNGLEWIDSLVFAENVGGWRNWQTRENIGKVVGGDRVRGFVVKFGNGTLTRNVKEEEVMKLSIARSKDVDTNGIIQKLHANIESGMEAQCVRSKKRKLTGGD
jgi:hypothetical protein